MGSKETAGGLQEPIQPADSQLLRRKEYDEGAAEEKKSFSGEDAAKNLAGH